MIRRLKALNITLCLFSLVDHSSYDWAFIAAHSPLILDTRNALQGHRGNIVKL